MEHLKRVQDIVANAQTLMILTGAGISVASGVPVGAVNHSSTSFLTTVTSSLFREDPEGVWSQHLGLRRELVEKKPNVAHLALAELARRKPHTLVTQNIDGLHEASGHSDVVPIHGTLWANRCTECGASRPDRTLLHEALPRSPCCDALERPDIIWIRDSLNKELYDRVDVAVHLCDVLLVIGTSGQVMPVGMWPTIVRGLGRKVIEINPNPSRDVSVSLRIQMAAEEFLPRLIEPFLVA